MTQVPYPGQRPFNRSAVSVALFKQIHLHMDVRLALGWAGVLVAVAASLSTAGKSTLSSPSPQFGPVSSCTCLVKERTSSSSLTCPLFSSCVILTALQALYTYFVEAVSCSTFVGRCKTFSKRIIIEHITISLLTLPVAASSSQPSPTYSLHTSGGKSLLAKNCAQDAK